MRQPFPKNRYPIERPSRPSRPKPPEKAERPDRPPALTTPYRRRQSGFVKLILRRSVKSDLARIRRCVDAVLTATESEGLDRIAYLDSRAWTFDPAEKGAAFKDIFVEAKEVERRRMAARKGGLSGVPYRLHPTFPNGLKRRTKAASALFDIDFVTLTLPLRWSWYERAACKPAGGLFDLGYRLVADCPDILQVSPVLHHPIGLQGGGLYDIFPPREPQPAAADPGNWHLDNIAPGGLPDPRPTGAGVVIGHPDTGHTEHPELNFGANGQSPNYADDRQFNVLPDAEGAPPENADQPADAREPIVSERTPGRNHYHGTRTASVMVSHASGDIEGVAPGAAVMPIRCVQDVIILGPEVDDDALAHAITLAVDNGAHVISISLGGYPCSVVRYAVQYAAANDVIVVAAAGNYWPMTVYPAAYPECVAVGGSTADDMRWQYSGRNHLAVTAIQIAAPAEYVRQAFWRLDGSDSTGRDHGTSFATAMTAGAAALWLERHGRDRLIADLDGRTPLTALFIAHLTATAREPAEWDTALDGPGILNLTGLLDPTTMPDPTSFSLPPGFAPYMEALGPDPVGEFQQMFLDPLTGAPTEWLGGVLGDNPLGAAGAFGEELMTLAMTNPMTVSVITGAGDAAAAAADAAADAADAAASAAEAAADAAAAAAAAAADAAEAAVDAMAGAASDALNDAAGWFGI